VIAGCGPERLFDEVIARDDRGIVPAHQRHGFGDRLRLPRPAGCDLAIPAVEVRVRLGGVCRGSLIAQHSKRIREVGGLALHPGQEFVDERPVVGFLREESELGSHAVQPILVEQYCEAIERRRRVLDCTIHVGVEQGQHGFGKPRQVPLRDRRLIAVGVTAGMIDRAEDRGRVVRVHKRARPIVDRFAGERHVVGVHYAVDEPDQLPACD
jgi:hypothetical protein